MIESLQDFTQSLPEALQWLGVMLIGAVPFVESYGGSAIGVIVGVPTALAIGAAVVGNIVSMLALVQIAHLSRAKVTSGRQPRRELSRKQQRIQGLFERFGVPGVSLLGQWILPSQITSSLMVSFGAARSWVVLWQVISIVVWGVSFGVLAHLGISMLG